MNFCSERPISVRPVNFPMQWNEPKVHSNTGNVIGPHGDLALEKQHSGLISNRRADENEFDVALDEF